MKSRFILSGALAAMLIMSGCGGGNDSGSEAGRETDTVSETLDASYSESAAADTEETTESTETAETEETEADAGSEEAVTDDTSADIEKEDEQTDSQEKLSDGVFHGSGYTLTIDGDTWIDMDSMMDFIGRFTEETMQDYGFNFTAEQYSEIYDGMFVYPEKNGANFNMTVIDIGIDMDISADLFGGILEQQYSSIEGCEVISCGDENINGFDSVRAEVKMTSGDVTLRMVQNCFWESGRQMVITFTAHEDDFDSLLPEYEKVLGSIEFE